MMRHPSPRHPSLLKVITLLLVRQLLRHGIAPINRRSNRLLEAVVVGEVTQTTMVVRLFGER